MLTLQRLLLLAAAVALTIAVAVVVGNAMQNADPALRSAAVAIAAGKPAKLDNPISVRQHLVYYDGSVLNDRSGMPVYIAALGNCPPVGGLLNKTYTRNNATIHVERCSLLMPWIEGDVVTHYVFTCNYGSDFKPELAEMEVTYGGRVVKVRVFVVSC